MPGMPIYTSAQPKLGVMPETTSGTAEVIWQGQWTADIAGNAFLPVGGVQRVG